MPSPRPPSRVDALNSVISSTLNDDLRAEAHSIVRALLADARRTIAIGDRRDKDALMRVVLPSLLKAATTEQNEADRELIDAMDRMTKALRGENE